MNSFPFTTSFWFDTNMETTPPLTGAKHVDVAVIGGGFAGLSAARDLKQSKPELSVAIVDGKHIGYGASGRNAGWVMGLPPLIWLLDNLDDPRRLDEIRWTARLCQDNIAELGRLVARENINCDWKHTQHVLVARNSVEAATLRWIAPRFTAVGMHCEYFEKNRLPQLVGYPATAALAYEIVTVQPFRLARGLQKQCLRLGVQIYENTPVTQVRSTKRGVCLTTAGGATLTAQKVIIATNAYSQQIDMDVELPSAKTYHTYMLATEPLEQEMLDCISQVQKPFGDPTIFFFIGRIHDNRLLFNGIDRASQNTPADDRHLPSFTRLYRQMLRRFPFLENVPLAGAWGGAVQQTSTDAPIVSLAPGNANLILNMGYGGGSGVGMALLSGRLTTDLVLQNGAKDSDARRLRLLYANSRFPRLAPVRAALGVAKRMIFG